MKETVYLDSTIPTMIESEILKEKDRVQAKLSKESASIREYLSRSHIEATEIAKLFGFCLQYADRPTRRPPT